MDTKLKEHNVILKELRARNRTEADIRAIIKGYFSLAMNNDYIKIVCQECGSCVTDNDVDTKDAEVIEYCVNCHDRYLALQKEIEEIKSKRGY